MSCRCSQTTGTRVLAGSIGWVYHVCIPYGAPVDVVLVSCNPCLAFLPDEAFESEIRRPPRKPENKETSAASMSIIALHGFALTTLKWSNSLTK